MTVLSKSKYAQIHQHNSKISTSERENTKIRFWSLKFMYSKNFCFFVLFHLMRIEYQMKWISNWWWLYVFVSLIFFLFIFISFQIKIRKKNSFIKIVAWFFFLSFSLDVFFNINNKQVYCFGDYLDLICKNYRFDKTFRCVALLYAKIKIWVLHFLFISAVFFCFIIKIIINYVVSFASAEEFLIHGK